MLAAQGIIKNPFVRLLVFSSSPGLNFCTPTIQPFMRIAASFHYRYHNPNFSILNLINLIQPKRPLIFLYLKLGI